MLMKNNNKNSILTEKIKAIKVQPDKSFKNKLLNSLEKEYETGFVKSSKQNFNLINFDYMKNITKKIVAWLAILWLILWTIWAFNTSYANEKNNVFDYISAGVEFVLWDMKIWDTKQFTTKDWDDVMVEMVSKEDSLKFDSMSKEEQIKQLQKEWKLPKGIDISEIKIFESSFEIK